MAYLGKATTVGGDSPGTGNSLAYGYNSLLCEDWDWNYRLNAHSNAEIIYNPYVGEPIVNGDGWSNGLRVSCMHRNLVFCTDNDPGADDRGTYVFDVDGGGIYSDPKLVAYIPDYHIVGTNSKHAIGIRAYNGPNTSSKVTLFSMATFQQVHQIENTEWPLPSGYTGTRPSYPDYRRSTVYMDDEYIVIGPMWGNTGASSEGLIGIIDSKTLEPLYMLPEPQSTVYSDFGNHFAYSRGNIIARVAVSNDNNGYWWISTPYLRSTGSNWVTADSRWINPSTTYAYSKVTKPDSFGGCHAKDGYFIQINSNVIEVADSIGLGKRLTLTHGLFDGGFFQDCVIGENYIFATYYSGSGNRANDKIIVFNKRTGTRVEYIQNPFTKANTPSSMTNLVCYGDTIAISSDVYPVGTSSGAIGGFTVIPYKGPNFQSFLENVTTVA